MSRVFCFYLVALKTQKHYNKTVKREFIFNTYIMKKAWPYIITIVIIVLGLMVIFAPSKTSTEIPTKPTLFIGAECPHCQKVEDFVAANGVDKKYAFDTKEVWHDEGNALIMSKVWQHCGLNAQMSVPLLWDGTKCYSGEVEVMNYFQTKL